jgi:hypothetical protein
MVLSYLDIYLAEIFFDKKNISAKIGTVAVESRRPKGLKIKACPGRNILSY